MNLAALISAYHDAEAPDAGLRATLPLAGRTLLERQARLAASAGASPIILFVERIPPELLAAIERLRHEGVKVGIARTAAEAAEAVHADDRLLLMADGFVADEVHVSRLVDAGPNSLLTLPDLGVDERFERIDAQSRWAGLALLTGQMLKHTAPMLQDWDLQSTLLRRAVQSGARQFSVRGEIADAHLTIVTGRADLLQIEKQILEGAVARRDSWTSRYLLGPAEQWATRLLMPTVVMPEWLRILAVVLTAAAAVLFANSWLWLGGILLLLSTPLDDVADRLAMLRMQRVREGSWWSYLLPATAGAALMSLAYALAGTLGWGCLPIAAACLGFLAALWIEVGRREVEGMIFLAERKGMTWLMLPFALTGSWLAGLFALTFYAAGSFFWAQHQVHRRTS
ncbi:MAG: hypothetical protein ACM3YM_12825 [Sphingomonadales bacterium]